MKKLFFSLLIALTFIGCAGTNFTWEQARQVKVGMSEKELFELMGKPYMVRTLSDQTIYTWSYSDGFTGAKAISIPVKNNQVVSVPNIPDSFQ